MNVLTKAHLQYLLLENLKLQKKFEYGTVTWYMYEGAVKQLEFLVNQMDNTHVI